MTAERGQVSTSPAPGQGIAEQLALLDRQIAQWAAAVRDVQASLRAVLVEEEEPLAEPAAEPDSESWEPVAAESVAAPPSETVAPGQPANQPPGMEDAPVARADRDDEAALLASLDAETVTLIRVRQRLSPGRSLRDLLSELDAGKRKGKGGPGES
jgi:hypothetical protein